MKSFLMKIEMSWLGRRGLMSTLLTLGLFLQGSLAHARDWSKEEKLPEFDFTVLAELNQRAAALGTLPEGFQEKPSPQVKALALEVRGYLQSSVAGFASIIDPEILRKNNVKLNIHPTLHSLLLASLVLDFSELRKTLQRRDAFLFYYRYRPEDLYVLLEASFPILLGLQDERTIVKAQNYLAFLNHHYEDVPRLQLLARSVVLAAFLLSETPECNATGSVAWNAQMLNYVRLSWLGAGGATVFLKSIKFQFRGSNEVCSAEEPYSERQLLKIAKKLNSED